LKSVPAGRWHSPACDSLIDFFVQVHHLVIESFGPVEKPSLHMADGQQQAIDILFAGVSN
jgi:hypothetical protein